MLSYYYHHNLMIIIIIIISREQKERKKRSAAQKTNLLCLFHCRPFIQKVYLSKTEEFFFVFMNYRLLNLMLASLSNRSENQQLIEKELLRFFLLSILFKLANNYLKRVISLLRYTFL